MPINLQPTKKIIYSLISLSLFFGYFAYLQAYEMPGWAVGGDDQSADDIQALNQDLNARRAEIDELKRQAEIYQQRIAEQRNEAFSLKNQINILDTEIAKVKIDIRTKQQEIEITNLDIKETARKIEQLKVDVLTQKDKIAELLRIIFQNDNQSYLEILLMNDTLSDFFNAAKYLENLHSGLHNRLQALKSTQSQLDTELVSLKGVQAVLKTQQQELEDQKYKLEQQELVKQELLDQTQASEYRFRSLLADAKADQNAINNDIVALEKEIRAKMEEREKANSLNDFKNETLIWPVTKNTITAYFHDPDYPYRYIFEHPAIDIRAAQGSTLSAAASGYVAKARRDPSCSSLYSYIMIVHANGLSTVYGHVSRIDVDEGEFVTQGQQIGLTGGIPRTCGAGRLTTGPHLHFEVRVNGIPVDPLGYLR